jgi:pimeloyl-ACP methyl ester carboxylesterase
LTCVSTIDSGSSAHLLIVDCRSRKEDEMPKEDASRFTVHHATVRGTDIAYVREGIGGFPIVLVHGWPSTKRTFWRNIQPLADAGFEVIVPDARGYGDSAVPDTQVAYADMPSVGRDIHALVNGFGHRSCVLVGFDFGAGVVQDCSRRHQGFVVRQVILNGITPMLTERYHAAGIPGTQLEDIEELSDHFRRQGPEADELATELNSPQKRVDYIKGFYTGRAWKTGGPIIRLAPEGSFDDDAATFHAEPFADAAHFRAAMGFYEAVASPELASEPTLLTEPDNTETMVLLGPEDGILRRYFTRRMEVAYGDRCVGPFLIEGAGHFAHWERADIVNKAIVCFCRDLLKSRRCSDTH